MVAVRLRKVRCAQAVQAVDLVECGYGFGFAFGECGVRHEAAAEGKEGCPSGFVGFAGWGRVSCVYGPDDVFEVAVWTGVWCYGMLVEAVYKN